MRLSSFDSGRWRCWLVIGLTLSTGKPRHGAPLDLGQQARGRPAQDADGGHADHHHGWIDVLLRHVEHAAETRKRTDQLGRDQRGP